MIRTYHLILMRYNVIIRRYVLKYYCILGDFIFLWQKRGSIRVSQWPWYVHLVRVWMRMFMCPVMDWLLTLGSLPASLFRDRLWIHGDLHQSGYWRWTNEWNGFFFIHLFRCNTEVFKNLRNTAVSARLRPAPGQCHCTGPHYGGLFQLMDGVERGWHTVYRNRCNAVTNFTPKRT